ncbi:hypothetical protein, partial [Escherichia coli]|uniref:hypothetical protein n=1 Tax=Escherichia coli TaxID=562 RepID=UPI00254EACC3
QPRLTALCLACLQSGKPDPEKTCRPEQYLRSTCNILNLQDFVGQISVAHQALRKRTCQQSE